ncbi:PLD nuclease N-terminal domain-containing protein [Streptomyces canus]|uniref:PLD nuclease N-terminal domain-containing protein n=1 Tax=Streptomyces canus TaxID=58343 RepID=UPI00225443FD|nr:PLD nuclease N-terminal domain-containing protein [Streptomyces canus]MCX4855384.1 PLD nuclease N-terminal domain-containing protein [Streptomyces canus]WSW39238.1 PLD nuclease N-terminal domain-containing protein [Streptomyces canus]
MNAVNLAYDYPLLGAFWTVALITLGVIWLVLLFRVIGDIFRDRHMRGLAKTAWLFFVIAVPFLGVFVYVMARGGTMAENEASRGHPEGGRSARAQMQSSTDDISVEEYEHSREELLHH